VEEVFDGSLGWKPTRVEVTSRAPPDAFVFQARPFSSGQPDVQSADGIIEHGRVRLWPQGHGSGVFPLRCFSICRPCRVSLVVPGPSVPSYKTCNFFQTNSCRSR
jgi:hypothetical protein